MQAVGRLGSYITQGVYTVSGPFHPFGGAVDIVVVQQQDGSFKSSPWYVRFGKFQGVLKAKERVVGINVNGVEAEFHMYLDHKGEAFFLREVDAEESESVAYPSSSVDGTDDNRGRDHMLPGLPFKPKSCNFDSERSNSLAQIDVNNVEVVARTGSSHSRILGFVFGRRSFGREVVEDGNVKRVDSLERAEIAANLLELKWSTNLAGGRPPRDDSKLNEEACSRTEQHCIGSESTRIDITKDGERDPNSKGVISDRTRSDSQVACAEPEAPIEKQLNGEEVSGISAVDIPGNNISVEDNSAVGVQSLVECECEKSESLKVGMDCSSDQTPHEELCLASRGCGEVHVLAEVTVTEEATKMVNLGVPVMKVSEFHSQQTDCPDFDVNVHDVADVEDIPIFPKPQTLNMGLGHCSVEEFKSNYDTKSSSHVSLDDQALDENNIKDKDVSSMLSSHQESVADCFSRKTSGSPSAHLEEECFLFSDLDKIRIDDQFEGSVSPEYIDKEDNISNENGTEKVNQSVDANCNLHSSIEKSTTENQKSDLQQLRVMSSPIVIPRNEAAGEEFRQLIASLPNISSSSSSLGRYDVFYPLSQSLDSKSKSLQWKFPGEDDSKCLGSDDNRENQLSHEELGAKDDHNSGEFKSTVLKLPVGDPSGQSPSPGGNWRIWPFSFSRSGSRNAMLPPSDAKNTTFGNSSGTMTSTDANKNGHKPNLMKKKVRETTPTSEQLASLNLKEGRNTVSFAFSTAMLGKQRVDARIYLWKWNTHIVISDVDGTITKSDVLGQFMPLVGVDWSQTGVTHLFSAIKENGYQLLFLSARSISQAYLTRQFLLNLKQDGKALPDGPVVISPDGLFPSLYREVIRRVPHEFKIACLEDIRALFPPDRNPFYAGFGNRDTDEISYLKVGVPKGKIFIINPRGEIVVNRCLNKNSYTSLHALVNGVFPPMNSSEQQEDFNSWNFWKLPPPVIDT